MKKPELIIHIGTPKTGSTSLQRSFEHNINLLHKEGIFYPLSLSHGFFGRELNALIQNEAREQIIGTDKKLQICKMKTKIIINKLLTKFQKGPYQKMLISEENLFAHTLPIGWNSLKRKKLSSSQVNKWMNESYLVKVSILRQLFVHDFDIKIVCYLRRPDLYIESYYNELCKINHLKNIKLLVAQYSDVIKNYNHFLFDSSDKNFNLVYKFRFADTYYYKILSIWSNVFGKENIIVKPFEKKQMGIGLVKDFFIHVLNIDPMQLDILQELNINERISRDVLEYVINLESRSKLYINQGLVDISNQMGDVKRYQNYFTLDERKKLLQYHSEGNQKIAREFLNRKDGVLFYEEIKTMNSEPYPGLTGEKIALLNKEFAKLSHKTISNEIKKVLNATRLYVQYELSTENYNSSIKKWKCYVLTVMAFSRQILRKIMLTMKL